MRIILRPLHWIYCIYAFLLFIVVMLLLFPFVLLSSLLGIIRGGNLIYRICMLWGDIWFALVGIFHRNIYESRPDPNKQYIFIINHISFLDAPAVVKTIRRPIRALGKIEMKNVPVFGFIYSYAVVKVNRGSAEDRAKSVRNLKSVLRKGISLVIFPEGTFNLTHQPLKDFYDGAFRVAIETQTTIQPVLFLDTYDRMHYKSVFSLNPGINRSVFLEEIPVDGLTMNDVPALKKRVYDLMDHKLRVYKASWIGPQPPKGGF
jgi:1-acyl-sn-glycerol-3-phosphate acyltransferase